MQGRRRPIAAWRVRKGIFPSHRIFGLWDGVCGGGSVFNFRLAVHGDCDPPFDGRRQMAVHGKKTGFFVQYTVLLHQGYGQADNGKPVLSFQWENRAGAGQ